MVVKTLFRVTRVHKRSAYHGDPTVMHQLFTVTNSSPSVFGGEYKQCWLKNPVTEETFFVTGCVLEDADVASEG